MGKDLLASENTGCCLGGVRAPGETGRSVPFLPGEVHGVGAALNPSPPADGKTCEGERGGNEFRKNHCAGADPGKRAEIALQERLEGAAGVRARDPLRWC